MPEMTPEEKVRAETATLAILERDQRENRTNSTLYPELSPDEAKSLHLLLQKANLTPSEVQISQSLQKKAVGQ